MAIDFISLPQNIITGVCTFLNDKALLQMREVSKSTKHVVGTLFYSQKAIVDIIDLCASPYSEKMIFELEFKTAKACMLWRFFIASACTSLHIPLPGAVSNSGYPTILHVLKPEKVMQLLTYLTSFAHRTIFPTELRMSGLNPEMIDCLLNLLKETTISTIRVTNPMDIGPDIWLHMIKKFEAKYVYFLNIPRTEDTIRFLLEMAYLVDSLIISMHESETGLLKFPMSIAREILSRKCTHFRFEDLNGAYALADLEEIVQFLHHQDRKLRFELWNSNIDSPMFMQLGEYKLQTKIWSADTIIVIIEHID